MSLYEGSVKKPIMTSLCFVAVAIMGLFSLTKLPIDLHTHYTSGVASMTYLKAVEAGCRY